jgi:hypothetical protein
MRFAGLATAIVALSASTASLTFSRPAEGALITFDEKPTGRKISNQYASSPGVTFSGDNYRPGGPDQLIIFKSDRSDTPDEDLEFPWSSGNLAGSHLDKILIVAENLIDFDANDLVDNPDDEAEGGSMFLKFNQPISSFGVDFVDIELSPALDSIEFLLNGVSLKTITLDQFTNPLSPFYDSTIVWADHSANRIKPLTTRSMGIPKFNEVVFRLPECVGIDNIEFEADIVIPEPATASLLLAALPALVLRRRR